ncbi:hypothetical protein LTR78_004710 [Recurvomyces mirabilis]|uniref:Uncharacterized protein n=1 Tax=Recurvomyces mirabilis TaxID=574656 RepID=A0AAE0WPR4_9PEZI|nr:hypothetical protein LTR78_004710 [Recurvomyces mirabilis]
MSQSSHDSDRFADLDRGSEEFQAAYRDFDEEYKRLHHDHNAAERVLPNIRYNTIFTMLQGLVFDIDPTSATPIALQIRLELSDDEIRPLLEARRLPPSAAVNRLSLRARPHVRNERLREEIRKARSTWAQKLAAHDFIDVDIRFTVAQYQVEPFKSIKEELAGLGAKCYHFSQFRQDTTSMTVSMVVKPFVLDHVLPFSRQTELGVTITTNTAPAWSVSYVPLTAATDTVSGMVLASPAADEQSPYDLPDPTKKPPNFGLRAAPIVKRDPCEALIQDIMGRQRSNTLQKVRVVSKTRKPWHIFSSSARAEQQQPAWTQESRPFRGDPGIWGDDQWWLEDHAKREALINSWKKATWCEELGAWPAKMHRNLSHTGNDPSVAVADKDFVLLPGLSPTYVTDRSRQWYEDNIEAASRVELQREYVAAEKLSEVTAGQAQAFWRRFVQVQINAKLNPWQQPTSFENAQMKRTQQEVAKMLIKAEDHLAKKADACEIRLSQSKFNVMDRLRMKALREIEAAPHGGGQPQPLQQVRTMAPRPATGFIPGQVMPDTPVPRHLAPQMARQKRASCPRRVVLPAARRQVHVPITKAKPDAQMADMSKQATTPAITVPPRPKRQSDAAGSVDTMPFPTYIDPMVQLTKQFDSVSNSVARMSQTLPQSFVESVLSTVVDSDTNSINRIRSSSPNCDAEDDENSIPAEILNSITSDIPCSISSGISESITRCYLPSLPNSISNDIPSSISHTIPPSLPNSLSYGTPRSIPHSIPSSGVNSMPPILSNSTLNDVPSSIANILPRSILQSISRSIVCPKPPSPAAKALTDILLHANDLKQLRLRNSAARIDSAQGSQVQRVQFAVTEGVYDRSMMSGGGDDADSDEETVVDEEHSDGQEFDEADDLVHDIVAVGIEAF